ncbi:MAG: hypothetical protein ABIQ59_06300 [Nocardioidaceae bacterium]
MASTRSPLTDRRLLLRQEVGRFRARESRRVFDLSVHVGVLGGARDSFVVRAQDLPAVDTALRTDVLAALVEDSPDDWRTAWLVRPGTPEPHDLDLQWLAAASSAFGMHGRTLDGFFVLTRSGWRDVLSGESRVWKRLRLSDAGD